MKNKIPTFFDIHTHLNFSDFDRDREEAYKRAQDAGVVMINVGTDKETSKSALEFAKTHEGTYTTVGAHPTHDEPFDFEFYKKLGQDPKVVGIGECGLDYFRIKDNEPRTRQTEIFIKHIELAKELKKPLMLHIRNAYKDALEILKKYPEVRGNSHFFAGNWEEAKGFLDLGHTLSFTGVITFTRDYDEVIRNAPLDMIMSETDAPYVSPIPYRGKRNEPVYVIEVVKKIAEVRGEDYEKVRQTLFSNAIRFFQLKS